MTSMSRADSPLRDKLIFVVGARRSGTNWLQRAIAAHPDVVAAPSETFLIHELVSLRDRFQHGSVDSPKTGRTYIHRDAMLDQMRALCDAVFAGIMDGLDPKAKRFVERTPDHVRDLDLVGELYPDAHVVHIIRDGRDVVRSLLTQSWGPSDAVDAALEWRSAIEAARASAPALPHYHEVIYEEMFADPATHVRELYATLGLPTSDADLESAFAEVEISYNADPTSSIAVAKWTTELDPAVLAVVDGAVGDLLAELGYPPSSTRPATRPATREPTSHTSESFARKAVGRLRARKQAPDVDLETKQAVVDAFLSAAASDPKLVTGMLTDAARIRIVDGDDRFDARGESAVRRLVEELLADDALRGRQVLGYNHPAAPVWTVVAEYESGGRRQARVFVLVVDGRRIKRVAYYRLS
jgi:hypothetical protein